MFAREIFNYLLSSAFLAGRQKDHSEAEVAGKADALFAGAFAHEGIWDGHQQAGAVAATAIGVDTTAMGQAQQRSQGALHDLVRRAAAELVSGPKAAPQHSGERSMRLCAQKGRIEHAIRGAQRRKNFRRGDRAGISPLNGANEAN